jgi:general stress protein YciG
MANTSKRGFASMDPAKQREIASKGGRAAHAKGTAHEFTSDEARVAGRKGGEAVSRDRNHMSQIGREGGHSRGQRARAAAASTTSGSAPSTNSGSSLNTDNGRQNISGSGSQPFVRQANEERGFEPGRNAGMSGGYGARDGRERTENRDRVENRDRRDEI